MALAEVRVRVLDDIGAFAGSVSDEEDGALLQVFGKAVFVYYDRCGFGDLDIVWRSLDFARDDRGGTRDDGRSVGEYCRVDFHSAGVDHRDYEEGIPDLVGDDGQAAGGDVEGVVGSDNRIGGDVEGVVGGGNRGRVDVEGAVGGGNRGRVDVEGAVGDGLGYQGVEGADGKERLVRAEAEALGGGYAHAQAGV